MGRDEDTSLSPRTFVEELEKILLDANAEPNCSARDVATAIASLFPSPAARDVLAERARHKSGEGWTDDHDDMHDSGQMANAAACYAATAKVYFAYVKPGGHFREGFRMNEYSYKPAWPWGDEWWKPKDRRRDLVRAGALILAEIERLDRASQAEGTSHE